MTHSPQKIIFMGIGIVFFLFILLFGYYRFSPYIQGPLIIETNIKPYQTINNPIMRVKGKLKNTSSMKIENRDVMITDSHTFDEIIVLSPGRTIIEMELMDTFGKTRLYKYEIYNNPLNPNDRPYLIP